MNDVGTVPPVAGLSRRRFLAAAAAGAVAAWTPIGRVFASAAEAPPGVPLYKRVYENWAKDLVVDDLWACAPTTSAEVVTVTNWAVANGWKVRPNGSMHSFSPITVTSDDPNAARVVLVDTGVHLTAMEIAPGWDVPAVRVETGALVESVLGFLETHGLGWTATPAPGNVTIGGVLAIDGHGACLPAEGESRLPGATYGSLSNLVLEVTAVVWHGNRYELRRFNRRDKDVAALLVHLGRAFITEVVLQASSNVNLRCQSITDVPASELFAHPAVSGERSFSALVDRTGRVESIWFPFTERPWLKVWSVAPEKPAGSRTATEPYNYVFADAVPAEAVLLADEIVTGNGEVTPVFGQLMYHGAVAGLAATQTADLWGPSKNTLLYVKPETFRVTTNGYTVLCRRRDIQEVVADFVAAYLDLRATYEARGEYPSNMPVEIRCTGLDHPSDVAIGSATTPSLSALAPRADHPDWDVAVWMCATSFPGTPSADAFYAELEQWLVARFGDALRPEWSKRWGFDQSGRAWTDVSWALGSHPGVDAARQTLNRLDPHRVFTNPFLERLLP